MANIEGDEIYNHYDDESGEKDPFIDEEDKEEEDNAGITDDQTNYIQEKTTGDVDEIIEEQKEEEDNINQPVLRSNGIPHIEPEEIDGDDVPLQEGGQNILFQVIKKRKMKSKQATKKKYKPQKRKSKRKEKSKLRNTRKKGKKKTRRKSKK
jgi:hypothetical protein